MFKKIAMFVMRMSMIGFVVWLVFSISSYYDRAGRELKPDTDTDWQSEGVLVQSDPAIVLCVRSTVGDRVNIRSTPDMGNNVIGKLNPNDELLYIRTLGSWYGVSYEGVERYVSSTVSTTVPCTVQPDTPEVQTYEQSSNCFTVMPLGDGELNVVLNRHLPFRPETVYRLYEFMQRETVREFRPYEVSTPTYVLFTNDYKGVEEFWSDDQFGGMYDPYVHWDGCSFREMGTNANLIVVLVQNNYSTFSHESQFGTLIHEFAHRFGAVHGQVAWAVGLREDPFWQHVQGLGDASNWHQLVDPFRTGIATRAWRGTCNIGETVCEGLRNAYLG